jgi:hypothetical protein
MEHRTHRHTATAIWFLTEGSKTYDGEKDSLFQQIVLGKLFICT